MRKKMQQIIGVKYKNINNVLILVMIFLLLTITLSHQNINAQRLIIQVEEEVIEGQTFKVSVLDEDAIGNTTPWLVNVTILFYGIEYQITEEDEDGEKNIRAPEVSKDIYYQISASKDGYESNKTYILVKNKPQLIVTPQDLIIEADKKFWVKITEDTENGKVVSGVKVWIQSDPNDQEEYTGEDGIVYLNSPTDRDSITLRATKEGYEDGSKSIKVEIPPNLLEILLNNPYFPIIIAIILLISVIIFVNIRQRKNIYDRAHEISKDKTIKKYDNNLEEDTSKSYETYNSQKPVKVKSGQDAKVEEIRIIRPKKEKEVVPVSSEKDDTEKVINKKKMQKHGYDWFEGTDDMRYEIDKITGEIDEEGLDKWYEGIDELRDKIDEKMKKKNEKKREEKDG